MISICFVYFRSLTLANLAAALFSVRQQDFSRVQEVILLDNNTDDDPDDVVRVASAFEFPVPVRYKFSKHKDPSKTHSWSTNAAVGMSSHPWIFFTRADYLLDAEFVRKAWNVVAAMPPDWNGFVTSNGYQLNGDVGEANHSGWRHIGASALRRLPGVEIDYTCIDTGVWMARRNAFDSVGGLDEGLTAWGHAQTHFQWKLFNAGVECVRLPEVLYYHPMHGAERNIDVAHRQLGELGVDLRAMWDRYHGPRIY